MPSLWIDALKQFNFERGAWSIPRKGSDDYVKVRALMADKAGKDAKKVEASAKKAESPKMIKEHERLTKVLEQGAKGGKDVKKVLAKEAKIQKKELKEMKK